MNFLKITGLVVGTGSVVGGTRVDIYCISNKNAVFKVHIVFKKKLAQVLKLIMKMQFLKPEEYDSEIKKFYKGKNNIEKYEQINKIVEIF